jgi:hypothetical protein
MQSRIDVCFGRDFSTVGRELSNAADVTKKRPLVVSKRPRSLADR